MERLQKKLRRLIAGETIGLMVIVGSVLVGFAARGMRPRTVTILAAIGLMWVLLQGSWYWIVRLRYLRLRKPVACTSVRVFRALAMSNTVLLGACWILIASRACVTLLHYPLDAVAAIGLNALATAEHVNYYHLQLARGNGARQFRRSSLRSLLRACRAGGDPRADGL